MNEQRAGFTIFEILIVVAILAILALVPLSRMPETNARTRSSRAKADIRLLGAALEQYQVDYQVYPPAAAISGADRASSPIKTPPTTFESSAVAFAKLDPFTKKERLPYVYYTDGTEWIVLSTGPDRVYNLDPRTVDLSSEKLSAAVVDCTYDPTNGSFSAGDIYLRRTEYVEAARAATSSGSN